MKGKNYRMLCGKPLFEWSILSALDGGYIDHIILSTNDEEIIRIYEESWYKDKVMLVRRPAEYATATSKNEDAMIHACDYCKDKGILIDWVVNLQPTSPIRTRSLIDDAVRQMHRDNKLSLMTVKIETPLFVQRDGDKIKWHFDRLNRPMRQDIKYKDYFYKDDGCLYITDVDVLRKDHCRLDGNPHLFINNHRSGYQIDNETDFIIVEAILESLKGSPEFTF